MSILIKGMEMPKNCETCELSTTDSSGFFGCCVTGNIVMRKREQDKPSWCPLIELPPHGRLIDADALTDAIELIDWYHQNKNKDMVEGANSDEEQAWYREQDIYAAIDDAPTIIESEGEDG